MVKEGTHVRAPLGTNLSRQYRRSDPCVSLIAFVVAVHFYEGIRVWPRTRTRRIDRFARVPNSRTKRKRTCSRDVYRCPPDVFTTLPFSGVIRTWPIARFGLRLNDVPSTFAVDRRHYPGRAASIVFVAIAPNSVLRVNRSRRRSTTSVTYVAPRGIGSLISAEFSVRFVRFDVQTSRSGFS